MLVSLAGCASEEPAYRDDAGDMSIALTGDSVVTQRLSVHEEPAFLALRRLLREATAAFTNLEVLFHEFGDGVIPAPESGGSYMHADPELAHELAWMGFDMVSRANNHAMDFGAGGMRATTRAVEGAGLVHAGVGEDLEGARRPAYLETSGGRIALISVASTFPEPMRAGPRRADVRGRPGLSPLDFGTLYLVPSDRLQVLRELHAKLPLPWTATDGHVRLGDTVFAAGPGWGRATKLYEKELTEITAVVTEAARHADWVVFSSHTHESGDDRSRPPQFLVELARATIDAGADVFVAHGPHVLRGVEIYRGKPIFYSLGNFAFQNLALERQPQELYDRYGMGPDAQPEELRAARLEAHDGGLFRAERYWKSVVAVPRFRTGRLSEVRLHPITLGHALDRAQRGRPKLAGEEHGRSIIEELAALSKPFGTEVEYRDGVGIVRP